jgi:hypothetical protein
VVRAQAKLRDFARRTLLAGKTAGEPEKMCINARTQDPVLRDIRQEIYERWGMDAFHTVEKKLAEEARKKRTGGQNENEGRN